MVQLSNSRGLDARDGRRSLVRAFDVICSSGPLARSTLRAALQTSPSTVTLSVQTLRERGLVVETETGGSTGGRRPKILDLAPTLGGVVAIDVGGINLRVAAANMRAQILAKTVVSTPASFEQVGLALRAGLQQVRDSLVGPMRTIAVAVPGVVDPVTGSIGNIENLPGWRTDVIAADNFQAGMGDDPELAAYAEAAVNSVTRVRPDMNLPWHRLGIPPVAEQINGIPGKEIYVAHSLTPEEFNEARIANTQHGYFQARTFVA